MWLVTGDTAPAFHAVLAKLASTAFPDLGRKLGASHALGEHLGTG
jgi:hypothetical protein